MCLCENSSQDNEWHEKDCYYYHRIMEVKFAVLIHYHKMYKTDIGWKTNEKEKQKTKEMSAYIHVSFDSSIVVVFTKTDFRWIRREIAKKKAVKSRLPPRKKNEWMNGAHWKDLFFLHPNMKCHLFRCGSFFSLVRFSPISSARIFGGVALAWQLKEEIERVIFLRERICGNNLKRFHSF